MSTKPIGLGGWSGINNVAPPDARTFQIPGGQETRRAALVAALDVDLDEDGWVKSRLPTTSVIDLSLGRSAFATKDRLLVHDANGIYAMDLTTDPVSAIPVVTDLISSLPIQFLELDGQVYWANDAQCGRILADGTAANWGLAPPAALSAAQVDVGLEAALPFGTYLVTATCVDAAGIESGAPVATQITLPLDPPGPWGEHSSHPSSTWAIQVQADVEDPNAVAVNYYLSPVDAEGAFYAGSSLVGAAHTILGGHQTLQRLETQHMVGPPLGGCLFAYRGVLMTTVDEWVFPASPLSPHLFSPHTDLLYLPGKIRAAAGLAGGFWLGTDNGLFWLTGDSLDTITWERKDQEYYAKGTLILDGSLLPVAQSPAQVALFVNSQHLVVCTADGRVIPVPQYTFGSVVGKRAAMAFAKRGDLSQVFVALSEA